MSGPAMDDPQAALVLRGLVLGLVLAVVLFYLASIVLESLAAVRYAVPGEGSVVVITGKCTSFNRTAGLPLRSSTLYTPTHPRRSAPSQPLPILPCRRLIGHWPPCCRLPGGEGLHRVPDRAEAAGQGDTGLLGGQGPPPDHHGRREAGECPGPHSAFKGTRAGAPGGRTGRNANEARGRCTDRLSDRLAP